MWISTSRYLSGGLLAAMLSTGLLPATMATAQSVPDLQDLVIQGEQINRGAEAATRGRDAPRLTTGREVDGEAGIYILNVNRIFHVMAGAGLGYTDNPTRTDADTGGSFFADFAAGAGLSTRIDEKVDFGLNVSVNGREFFKDYGPSSRSISTSMSAGVPLGGPAYFGMTAFGGYSYDGGFHNGVAFYGLSGTLSAAFAASPRLILRPGVGVVRQWSGTHENNNTSLSGSVDVTYLIAPTVSLLGRGVVSRRWYDDFYEDVTFVKRRDTLYGVSATVAWQAANRLSVTATLAYDHQNSSLFLSKFDALETAASVTAIYRF